MRRGVVRIHPAIIALFVVMLFGVWGQAQAGPITNGPGVAPFVKLGVYQGVISIVPGGLTDSIMEIGNAGRDIATTGSLYLRPGTIGGQGGNVVITPQGGSDEGGELALQGAGSYQTWTVDIWRDRFRVHTNGQERLVFDGTAGNIYVPTGSICYGNVGSTNCLSVAGGPGATPTLDQVLGSGNNSVRSAALGAAVTPLSKLVVNNNLSLAGNANDGISTYANTTGSAVYAQQNNVAGYAGYFSGRVNITGDLIYKGRLKPTPGLQVCEIASDVCLGRYYYSTGTFKDPANPSTIKLFYDPGGSTTVNTVTGVAAYVTGTPQPTCDPGETLIQRNDPPAPESVYNVSNCGGTLANEFVNPGSAPYGSPQPLCRTNTTTTITILSYRDPFGCTNVNNPNRSVQALSTPTMLPSYNPRYELR